MGGVTPFHVRCKGGVYRIPPFFLKSCSIIVLLLLGTMLSGCSLMLRTPTVKCSEVNITGLGSEGVDLEVALQVENPNNFPVVVHGYHYALTVMDIPFSSGSEMREVTLHPGTSTQVLLPLRVPLGSIIDLLAKGPDPDRVPYGLEAVLDVSTPFVARQVPVKSSGRFAVPPKYRPDHYLKQLKRLLPWVQGEH
jgi:LEA14-like dessication related protein